MTKKNKHKQGGREVAHDGASSRAELARRISAVVDLFDTRIEAARAAGLSEDQLVKYRRGQNSPNFEALARMAAAKGVSLDWIAGASDTMQPSMVAEERSAYGGPERVAPLHRDVLFDVLAVVEERLKGRYMAPEKKAELILLLYEQICEEEGRFDRAKIVRIVDLAS